MKFKTRILLKEYILLMYKLTYKKAVTVIISIIGLLNFLFCIFYFTGIAREIYAKDSFPLIQLIFGIFIVFVIPILVYISSKKSFATNERLQEEMEYELTNDHFTIRGESFFTEMKWEKTYKIEELNNWFLIYQNKKIANLIPTRSMTAEEIKQARALFKTLKNVKVKVKS